MLLASKDVFVFLNQKLKFIYFFQYSTRPPFQTKIFHSFSIHILPYYNCNFLHLTNFYYLYIDFHKEIFLFPYNSNLFFTTLFPPPPVPPLRALWLRRKSKKHEIDFLFRISAHMLQHPWTLVAFHAHLMCYTHVHNNHNVYNMRSRSIFLIAKIYIIFVPRIFKCMKKKKK